MLLLNDGIVRAASWQTGFGLIELGRWLCDAVTGHYCVKAEEVRDRLPGPRTVLSSGWVAAHSFPEIRIDDMVLDYTRQHSGLSKLAESTGNPVIVSSPVQLQLNTAFSRAFLLDEAGGRAGLTGADFYVDDRFLLDVEGLVGSASGYSVVRRQRDDDLLFAVFSSTSAEARAIQPEQVLTLSRWAEQCVARERRAEARGYDELPSSDRHPWLFGFLLQMPAIQVNLPHLRTSVYRALGFFPFDEDPTEFMFDLSEAG